MYFLMGSAVCCLALSTVLWSLETAPRIEMIQAVWLQAQRWGENLISKMPKVSTSLCACLCGIFMGGKYRFFIFVLVHTPEPFTTITTVFRGTQRILGESTAGVCVKSDTDHVCLVSVTATWNSAVQKPVTVILCSTTAWNHWPSKTRNVSVTI